MGRLPAATTKRSAVSVCSPTCRAFGPVKWAGSVKTVTLSLLARHLSPASEIGSMRPKMRSRISVKCTALSSRSTPSRCASAGLTARLAG